MVMNKIKIDTSDSVCWLDQAHGIRTNEQLSSHLTHTQNAIKNKSITVFREFTYGMAALVKNFVISPLFSTNKYLDLVPENTNKKGLVIFFHGLNGKPLAWNHHIAKFEKMSKDCPEFSVDIFVPLVPKKGHCALDHAEITRFNEKISEWAEKNPGKPIVIFGQSNGSRIALHTELWLREHSPKAPVQLSLTGGVLFGTTLIQKLTGRISPKILNILSFGLLTPVACQELASGSSSSKDLLNRARLPLEDHVANRYYRKYAALYDSHVKELGSSLPILVDGAQRGKKEKEYILPDYGHNSIINAVTDEEVQKSCRWIKKQNKD
jgi:hypothetical protein